MSFSALCDSTKSNLEKKFWRKFFVIFFTHLAFSRISVEGNRFSRLKGYIFGYFQVLRDYLDSLNTCGINYGLFGTARLFSKNIWSKDTPSFSDKFLPRSRRFVNLKVSFWAFRHTEICRKKQIRNF